MFDRFPELTMSLVESKRSIEYIEDMLYYLASSSPHLQEGNIIRKLEQCDIVLL